MDRLAQLIADRPIVPYIRECDFAVRKPWHLPERKLLDYLIIYVQEGVCSVWVDGQHYELIKDDVCFIQPNRLSVLEGVTNTVTPFAHFDIFYHPERENSFPTRAGQVDLSDYAHWMQPRLDDVLEREIPVKPRLSNVGKFRDTFLKVVEYWQERNTLMQLRAQAGMMEIIIMLLEDHVSFRPSQHVSMQALNWITSYFSLNLSEPLSVEHMARRAHLSPSRFHEVFKWQYGTTPHQYLLAMRVNHACELLKTTDLSQEQIAVYCGFSDVHHLSKTLKRRTGMAPGAYRKKHMRERVDGKESPQ